MFYLSITVIETYVHTAKAKQVKENPIGIKKDVKDIPKCFFQKI